MTLIQINVNTEVNKCVAVQFFDKYLRESLKMSDKSEKVKNFVAPTAKCLKSKRPSTVSVATTSSRTKVPSTAIKDKSNAPRPKLNKNSTILAPSDMSMMKQESCIPDFDAENRQIAYGKFLRAMLEDCLVDEKIEREETQMDIQMGQLADRFQKTIDHLDKTNRRLKDISFVVEQKRLLDLKKNDNTQFQEMTKTSNVEDILKTLATTEQTYLDRLDTKNVDFGYDKESGHKQLLDAVNEAIEGFEQIKKHSNLDMNKFVEYGKSKDSLKSLEKDRFDLDSLKMEFEAKFPKFNEKLLKEASEKIMKMMQNENDEENDDDD